MSEIEEKSRLRAGPEETRAAKKPYRKPEFRFERVFETRALTCGKVGTTQAGCAHNSNAS
jgi:hypothetical protein